MNIKLLDDERAQVAAVAERWKASYHRYGKWTTMFTAKNAEEVYDQLAALPLTATAKDVAEIIGNSSWIGHHCDECQAKVFVAFQIGEEPDYESRTVVVCTDCARKYANYIINEVGAL